MASGILGTADLLATTVTDVYAVPVDTLTSMNINICNRNSDSVLIRLALSATTGVQANSEYIEYETSIEAYGVLERTGVVMQADTIVTMYSDTANVSVVVTGIEGSTI